MQRGAVFADKYRILGELGRGGMGEVYLAEDTILARRVALKLLPERTRQDPESQYRLVAEAKSAAALDHPYICNVHEVGESGGRLYFAMEYVRGQTLRERIARGPLPMKQVLTIAAEITEALEFAHEQGFIHRDIKPANIILTEGDHAKVMDFGLAKFVGSTAKDGIAQSISSGWETQDGISPGTPAYMSPEQLQTQQVDARSDIFSLGIVLYEMLTGSHPFRKETGDISTKAILQEHPRQLKDLVKNAPARLQQIIDKMLAKEAGERYSLAQEALSDLREVQSDLSVDWKSWLFRRPARMAAAVFLFALTGLGALWLTQVVLFKSPAKALAFEERDWILISDFDNLTGDPVFDGSLDMALTVGIQQSQYVNAFPRSRSRETLKRMLKDGVEKIDEALGSEIALREGIKGVLACQVNRVGNDYLLTGRILDPATQAAVFSCGRRVKKKEDVLVALDELAKKVRRGLGESMARISERQMPLPRATTSSLEALKLLSESMRAPGGTAVTLLLQAVDIDPDFAMAHAQLGMKFYINNNRTKGEEHFQKALNLLDRLTPREQLLIRALVEDWRGNRDQGIEYYKAYLAQYPDDSSIWYRLGYSYLITKRFELSIEAFEKVVAIDKVSAASYSNIAAALRALKRDEEALDNYGKAFELQPELITGLYVNGEYGFLLVKLGKTGEAVETFEKMLSLTDLSKKARGHRSLAMFNIYLGKYRTARDHFEKAVQILKNTTFKLSEFRDRLSLAETSLTLGQKDRYELEMAAVEKIQKELKIEPSFLYVLGRSYARKGRLHDARRQFEYLKTQMGDVLAASSVARSSQGDQANYHMLKGEIELAEGRFGEAIDSFETAWSLAENLSTLEALAFAYNQQGNTNKSVEKYRDFLRDFIFVGSDFLETWVLAHYELGKLLEEKDPQEAAKHLGQLLEMWKDADTDLRVLADAKMKYSRLVRQ